MLQKAIYSILQNNFNLTSLYPFQQLIITSILERDSNSDNSNSYKNQLIILPTGSGKSICFQLPAFLLKNLTVIVYPLLSLMNDQKRRMEEAFLKVAILKGGQTKIQREQIFRQLKNKELQVLITNAETVNQNSIIEILKTIPISLFVVDEVHTVSQWGESFRPSYLALRNTIDALQINQIIAFTATASPLILNRIKELLFANEELHLVYGNPDRANIYYRSLISLVKLHDLEFLSKDRAKRPLIVFCNSRIKCEFIAQKLQQRISNVPIRYYHAGLVSEKRQEIEKWFFSQDDAILISTSAYGMGVDKKNIRSAIHYDIPHLVEAFLQESGRAGRDNKQAYSIILYDYNDYNKVKHGDFKTLFEIATDNKKCKREAILKQLDYKLEYCFGCDVCDNRVFDEPDGQKEIVKLIFYYPFRFTVFEATSLLKGLQFNTYKSFSILSEWNKNDIFTAIQILIKNKIVKSTKLPFFKGRLYCTSKTFSKQVYQLFSKLHQFFYQHRR